MAAQCAAIVRIKNEADIVEPFVRHHARLLDRLIVIDNGSTDASLEIVRRLVEEGLPITILADDVIPYHQSEVMTYYSRVAFAQFDCERLFLLDIDEFLNVASRPQLDARIATIPHDTHGLIRWMTYAPSAADDAAESNPVVRITHRRAAEPDAFKLVLSKSFMGQADAVIIQGNHDLRSANATCRRAVIPELAVAHFPVRSIRQLQSKALAGWNAYIAQGGEDRGLGYQWKTLHEKLRSNPVWTHDDLYAIGAAYPEPANGVPPALVREPFPFAGELRYAGAETLEPLQVAIDCARDLARLYATAARAAEAAEMLVAVHEDVDRLRREAELHAHDRAALRALVNEATAQVEDLRAGKLIRVALGVTLAWRRFRRRMTGALR
jgi:hypothetical protein